MSRLVPHLIAAVALTATATASAQPAGNDADPALPAPATTSEEGSAAATDGEGSPAAEPAAAAETPEAAAPTEPKKAVAAEPQPKPRPRKKPPAPRGEPVYEPPPPGATAQPMVYEPPPPPVPDHLAPKTAFWLGGRIGWFVPFGNLWANCTLRDSYGQCVTARGVPYSDYASSGPVFEVDVGVRLGRRYNLLLLWERAQLGGGKSNPEALPSTPPSDTASSSADSDYYALGFRFSSDPDDLGFLTEFALGYRRARIQWDDGTELQLTNAPFEFRLGLGADIRLSSLFSLSPLATIGFGGFGDAEWVYPDNSTENARAGNDLSDTHGWFTLQLGGHFDLGGSG